MAMLQVKVQCGAERAGKMTKRLLVLTSGADLECELVGSERLDTIEKLCSTRNSLLSKGLRRTVRVDMSCFVCTWTVNVNRLRFFKVCLMMPEAAQLR
jgi:hypothetical protein